MLHLAAAWRGSAVTALLYIRLYKLSLLIEQGSFLCSRQGVGSEASRYIYMEYSHYLNQNCLLRLRWNSWLERTVIVINCWGFCWDRFLFEEFPLRTMTGRLPAIVIDGGTGWVTCVFFLSFNWMIIYIHWFIRHLRNSETFKIGNSIKLNIYSEIIRIWVPAGTERCQEWQTCHHVWRFHIWISLLQSEIESALWYCNIWECCVQ